MDGGEHLPPNQEQLRRDQEDAERAAEVAAANDARDRAAAGALQDVLEARRQTDDMLAQLQETLAETQAAQQDLEDRRARLQQERIQWEAARDAAMAARQQALDAHHRPAAQGAPQQGGPGRYGAAHPHQHANNAGGQAPPPGPAMHNRAQHPHPAGPPQHGGLAQGPPQHGGPPQGPPQQGGPHPGYQGPGPHPQPAGGQPAEDPVAMLARQLAAAQMNNAHVVRPSVISQMTLEPFEGKESEDWLGWKERIESLMAAEGTPADQRRLKLHLHLRGGALNFWRSLTPWERNHAPWQTIIARFDARYASPDNADYHEREFYARCYRGESKEGPHDFLQDLIRRSELAFPDLTDHDGAVIDNRTRERGTQVKRQFIAGMPPKMRNALFMKNQADTPAESLAQYARKKFAANKLSTMEEQIAESFNAAEAKTTTTTTAAQQLEAVVQALDGRFTRNNGQAPQDQNQNQGKPAGAWNNKQSWRNGPRTFTPRPGFAPPPNWAAVAAAAPQNWGAYAYGIPQAPPPLMAPAGFYPQSAPAPPPPPAQNQDHQHQGRQQERRNNQGQGQGQGQRSQSQGRPQRRRDQSNTMCFGCGKTGHAVTQCPTFKLPFRPQGEQGQGGQPPAQGAPAKPKQSKIPVDRVPAQQTINAAQVAAAQAQCDAYNWYAQNAAQYEQIQAAQAAYGLEGAEFVPGVTAGEDIDTDSSAGNE